MHAGKTLYEQKHSEMLCLRPVNATTEGAGYIGVVPILHLICLSNKVTKTSTDKSIVNSILMWLVIKNS